MEAEVTKEKGMWNITIGNDVIRVENKLSICKLFVNDKLQDVYPIMLGAPHLYGKLPNGKEVKAVIGGDFSMHCYVFVDCECVLED